MWIYGLIPLAFDEFDMIFEAFHIFRLFITSIFVFLPYTDPIPAGTGDDGRMGETGNISKQIIEFNERMLMIIR
jgi:hypothetical protein